MPKPSLLESLVSRDPGLFVPQPYSTAEPITLADKYLDETFSGFGAWILSNRITFGRWLALHREDWIRRGHEARVEHGYVFSTERLNSCPDIEHLANECRMKSEEIRYAFDVVLRYSIYGSLAGETEHYLNHPIRDAFPLPTQRSESGRPLDIPVRWRGEVAKLAPSLSQDEYVDLVHSLRQSVHKRGLQKMKPGEVDREIIRDICGELMLPPRLKTARAAGIGAAVLGTLASFPVAGETAAVAGGAIAVSSLIWTGKLPRPAARIRWLRWAVRWDVEDQAEERG